MTLDEVQAEVARIAELGRTDDEAAHAAEDVLHQKVLEHFAAQGHALAAAALETLDEDFARWCA